MAVGSLFCNAIYIFTDEFWRTPFRFSMNIIFFIAYLSTLSPLVVLTLCFRIKNISYELRLIRLLMLFSIVIDLACLFMSKNGINTHPLGNLFSLIQSIIFTLIFFNALKLKKFAIGAAIIYSTFFLINYFLIQSPYQFNSYSHTISSVLFILLALLYFKLLLKDLPEDFVYGIPMIWICVGVLVYYSGNIFLFILNNYFSNRVDGIQGTLWIIHNLLNISKNLLFFIALWQSQHKISSSSS